MQVCGQRQGPVTLVSGMDHRVHWIGGWVGSGASLDYLEEKQFLASVVIQTPNRPVRSLATAQATLSRLEKNLNYEFCPYTNFSSFLSSPPSCVQPFPSAPGSRVPSIYVWQNRLQSQKQRGKLQFCTIGLYFILTLLDNKREQKLLRSD
jgi:hypothetical protein